MNVGNEREVTFIAHAETVAIEIFVCHVEMCINARQVAKHEVHTISGIEVKM